MRLENSHIQFTLVSQCGCEEEKWVGFVCSFNGRLYGVPFRARCVLEFDPLVQESCELECMMTGRDMWTYGVLTEEGGIVCIPRNANAALEILPNTRTTDTCGQVQEGVGKWSGGALSSETGEIIASPFSAQSVLCIDYAAKVTSTFGQLPPTPKKWNGMVRVPGGTMICVPCSSSKVLVIYPKLKTFVTFGTIGELEWKFTGACFAPDGQVYCGPRLSQRVLKISPEEISRGQEERSYGYIGDEGMQDALLWSWPTPLTDGTLYCIPFCSDSALRIDWVTGCTTCVGKIPNGHCLWIGNAVGPDGNIYTAPYNSPSILRLSELGSDQK